MKKTTSQSPCRRCGRARGCCPASSPWTTYRRGTRSPCRTSPRTGAIIRYGVTLGYALAPIARGQWVNEHMLRLPTPPSLDDMPFGTNICTSLPQAPVQSWWGYRNPAGGYAGTRNLLGIQTTVQCVQGVLDVAGRAHRKELLPRYPHVDDVVAVNPRLWLWRGHQRAGSQGAHTRTAQPLPPPQLRRAADGRLPGLRKAHGRHAGRAGKQYAGKRGNLAGQQGL